MILITSISEWTAAIFIKFSGLFGKLTAGRLEPISLAFALRSLSERCRGNQFNYARPGGLTLGFGSSHHSHVQKIMRSPDMWFCRYAIGHTDKQIRLLQYFAPLQGAQ